MTIDSSFFQFSQNSVQVCQQQPQQPSNHITRSSWKNGLIPLSYNDNCDDNVIPKMKKNRKNEGRRRRRKSHQQAIKSRLSQFNTDPIMWYPEKQADFQSSASIHVKHIALVSLKKVAQKMLVQKVRNSRSYVIIMRPFL